VLLLETYATQSMGVFEVTLKSISSMILIKLKCISPFSNEEFDLTSMAHVQTHLSAGN